ncbi:MAG: hypothetical protein FWE88_00515 [Phycisphaerae bacterium]|nr:hypothetical protein [Phycisphaerae bacterium]
MRHSYSSTGVSPVSRMGILPMLLFKPAGRRVINPPASLRLPLRHT